MKDKLAIIIPAHNEEEVIIKTLKDLNSKLRVPCKILVVDDHSTDSTARLVKDYMKKNKDIYFIGNYGPNRGFSSTLKKGFSQAKADYVLPVMADLCDDPKTINKIYQKLDGHWDIVCGSRYMKGGGKTGGPRLQGFFSILVCKTIRFLTNIPTSDVSNAFKAYKKTFLKKIKIRDGAGVEISMEITMQSFFNGAKITEIPTFWRGRTVGQSKFNILQRFPKYLKIFIWSVKFFLIKKIWN